MPMWRLREQREKPRQLRTSSYPPCEPVPTTNRLSTFHRTFTLLNDSGIATGSGSFSAFCSHSTFSFGANAESDAADDHPDPRCRTFLNDPAPLRSWLLNDVVVRKGGRDDESCQGSTSQNCSHWEIVLHVFFSPKREAALCSRRASRDPPFMLSKGGLSRGLRLSKHIGAPEVPGKSPQVSVGA
jgi:hypothetical protein